MRIVSARIKNLRQIGILSLPFIFTAISTFAVVSPSSVVAQSATGQGKLRSETRSNLKDAKLRACEAKEESIKKRASLLALLATSMEDKFEKHAQRVKNYYTDKVLPSGKSVANYDSLIADIDTKKEAVAQAVSKAQNAANNFDCKGSDPKGQLTQFRKDMQAVKQALKAYRTSIKNLIVAVRSSTGTKNSENKSSPLPSRGPGANE